MNAHVNPRIAAGNVITMDKTIRGWRWLSHFGREEAFWLEPYIRDDGEPCVAAHRDRETAGDHFAAEIYLSLDELSQVNLRRAYMIVG